MSKKARSLKQMPACGDIFSAPAGEWGFTAIRVVAVCAKPVTVLIVGSEYLSPEPPTLGDESVHRIQHITHHLFGQKPLAVWTPMTVPEEFQKIGNAEPAPEEAELAKGVMGHWVYIPTQRWMQAEWDQIPKPKFAVTPQATCIKELPELGDVFRVPAGDWGYTACRVVAVDAKNIEVLVVGSEYLEPEPPQIEDERVFQIAELTHHGASENRTKVKKLAFWTKDIVPSDFQKMGNAEPAPGEEKLGWGTTGSWGSISVHRAMQADWNEDHRSEPSA